MDIVKTELIFDADQLLCDFNNAKEAKFNETVAYQMAITGIGNNDLSQGTGRSDLLPQKEEEYIILNDVFKGTYTEEVVNNMSNYFDIHEQSMFRLRHMYLSPKSLLSYHHDPTYRFHLPIYTNDSSWLIIDENMHKLTELGRVYIVDTTKPHTAINASYHDYRIHMIGCIK